MESQSDMGLADKFVAAANATREVPPKTAWEDMMRTAEIAGQPRAERIMKALSRFLGAPEAAGRGVEIAGERASDYQERQANRLNEAAKSLERQLTDELGRLGRGMNEVRDAAVAGAKDLANRAINFGLRNATAIEDRIVKVAQSPAGLLEKAAGGFEAKAATVGGDLASAAADQAAREMRLSEEQQRKLEEILRKQEAAREKMSAKHELRAASMQDRIEIANGTAAELKVKAANVRQGVEKRRIFKGLLARFGASVPAASVA